MAKISMIATATPLLISAQFSGMFGGGLMGGGGMMGGGGHSYVGEQCMGQEPTKDLRWVDPRYWGIASKICCHNTHGAEPKGFLDRSVGLFDKISAADGEVIFYDSVCGKPLFKAPVGRSFEAWKRESQKHGWPSFRPSETFTENVKVLPGGRMESVCGTHLGHNLPDNSGDRYCIDLVCVAGQPPAAPVAVASVPAPARTSMPAPAVASSQGWQPASTLDGRSCMSTYMAFGNTITCTDGTTWTDNAEGQVRQTGVAAKPGPSTFDWTAVAQPVAEEPAAGADCLRGDVMLTDGQSSGFIGKTCLGADKFSGTETVCRNGKLVEQFYLGSCFEVGPGYQCVQQGEAGSYGGAVCIRPRVAEAPPAPPVSAVATPVAAAVAAPAWWPAWAGDYSAFQGGVSTQKASTTTSVAATRPSFGTAQASTRPMYAPAPAAARAAPAWWPSWAGEYSTYMARNPTFGR